MSRITQIAANLALSFDVAAKIAQTVPIDDQVCPFGVLKLFLVSFMVVKRLPCYTRAGCLKAAAAARGGAIPLPLLGSSTPRDVTPQSGVAAQPRIGLMPHGRSLSAL